MYIPWPPPLKRHFQLDVKCLLAHHICPLFDSVAFHSIAMVKAHLSTNEDNFRCVHISALAVKCLSHWQVLLETQHSFFLDKHLWSWWLECPTAKRGTIKDAVRFFYKVGVTFHNSIRTAAGNSCSASL